MRAGGNKFYKPGLLLLALACLGGVWLVQRALQQQRLDPQLGIRRATSLGKNAPPMLEFTTVALGGFRGLIANALWIRASDLQDQGKYFEMVQLADWITKLEPTFVQVWLVQSWNMAYNISVKFSDPADRWRWVRSGIELLRDEGLRYNPREALIYRELAWFFQHKMGQNMDDAHNFYKATWAREMTDLFQGPRPKFDELLHPQTDAARQRGETLRRTYKMEPQIMKQVEDHYGRMEWRLPETHAIYWATVGLANASKKDLITLRRVIYQSLQLAVMRGRILQVRPDGFLVTGPDLDKIELANEGYEALMAAEEEKRIAIQSAHRNFLREVVYHLYTHNRLAEAQRWLKYLREKYPGAVPPNLTLDEYALAKLAGNLDSMSHDRIKIVLEGLISQYYASLAIGDDDRAVGLDGMTKRIWQFYDQRIVGPRERLALPPLEEMKKTIREELIGPDSRLPQDVINQLRTRLQLPAPTNAPPTKP